MEYWKLWQYGTGDIFWVPASDYEAMKGLMKATGYYSPGQQYGCTPYLEDEAPDIIVGKPNGVYEPDGTEVT